MDKLYDERDPSFFAKKKSYCLFVSNNSQLLQQGISNKNIFVTTESLSKFFLLVNKQIKKNKQINNQSAGITKLVYETGSKLGTNAYILLRSQPCIVDFVVDILMKQKQIYENNLENNSTSQQQPKPHF